VRPVKAFSEVKHFPKYHLHPDYVLPSDFSIVVDMVEGCVAAHSAGVFLGTMCRIDVTDEVHLAASMVYGNSAIKFECERE